MFPTQLLYGGTVPTPVIAIRCPHCGDLPVTEPGDLRTLTAASMLAGIVCFECNSEAHILLGGSRVSGTRTGFNLIRIVAAQVLAERAAK